MHPGVNRFPSFSRTIREKEVVAADVRRLKSTSSDTPDTEEDVRASSRRLLHGCYRGGK